MEKILFTTPGNFLSIKSAANTPYFYTERKGIDSVAFILIDNNKPDRFGLTKERKPPLDHRLNTEAMLLTAFGGSNDIIDNDVYIHMNEDEIINHFKDLVKTEVQEESGFNVDLDRITFVSKEFVSTQMNQFCYMFVVDVTDIQQGERNPQDAIEAIATIE